MQEQKAKQRERQKGKTHGPLSAEAKEKRRLYNKERMARPEVKAKMKTYREKKVAQNKAILARAAELGITPESIAAESAQPNAE